MESTPRKAKLSGDVIRALTPESKPYEVADLECPGLIVRVQPASTRYPDGTKTFYVRYRLADGRQARKKIGRFGLVTAQQARKAAVTERAAAIKGDDPQEEKRKAKEYTLKAYVADVYGPWVKQNRKSGVSTLRRLTSPFAPLEHKKLSQLNHWLLDKWKSERKAAGVSTATIRRDIEALRAMLNQAVTWGHLKANPIDGVKLDRVDNAVVRYLEPHEEIALRAALDKHDAKCDNGRFAGHLRPMVLISLNTGLRRGELFSLAWADVDLDARRLTVRGATSKVGTTRHVPLNDEAVGVLRAWRDRTGDDGLVFKSPKTGGRLGHIKTSWQVVLKDAGLLGLFRWHDLRHHFASMLVMRGASMYDVQTLLGHTKSDMTQRYAHLSPAHLAGAVALLNGPRNVVEFRQQERQTP